MNQYKKLLNNSFIFAIGNLGSKLITFFLLPLYTMKLSKSEFGITDLAQTTIQLILPIITLSIYDAVLRFCMDKEEDNTAILSEGFLITLFSSIVMLLSCLILNYFFYIPYLFYICLLTIVQSFQTLFSQYIKAIGQVKEFAINGIILSFFTALFSIIFLYFFDFKIVGFFSALVISNIFSCIYLVVKGSIFFDIRIKKNRKSNLKKMLSFSVPLIPNSIAWWLTNAVNRYFILYFLGTIANGIFAVANKIPMLLSVLNSIFFQAWQMSAIEEYNSKNVKFFYSRTFSIYSQFLFVSTSLILIILKPLIALMVESSYYEAWKYVPLLLLTVLYSSFSGFFGQNYIAAKNTFGIFTTTVVGSLINISGNLLLTAHLGLYGVGLSSAISFFILWIIRIISTKKFVSVDINLKNIVLNHIILFIQIFGLFQTIIYFGVIIQLISLIFLIFINRDLFLLFNSFFKKNKKK